MDPMTAMKLYHTGAISWDFYLNLLGYTAAQRHVLSA